MGGWPVFVARGFAPGLSSLMADVFSLFGPAALPDPLPPTPFGVFAQWWTEAHRAADQPDPNAMVLSTCGPIEPDSLACIALPSSRVVLCKDVDHAAGALTFFTNYQSRKGREIEGNAWACGLFFWNHAGRQIRVEGPVERVEAEASDRYFASRPLLSRLGAWASEQSQPIASRTALVERVREVMTRFGVSVADVMTESPRARVPRPDWWGGYRLRMMRVELWANVLGRLHDRAEWRRAGPRETVWMSTRLSP